MHPNFPLQAFNYFHFQVLKQKDAILMNVSLGEKLFEKRKTNKLLFRESIDTPFHLYINI